MIWYAVPNTDFMFRLLMEGVCSSLSSLSSRLLLSSRGWWSEEFKHTPPKTLANSADSNEGETTCADCGSGFKLLVTKHTVSLTQLYAPSKTEKTDMKILPLKTWLSSFNLYKILTVQCHTLKTCLDVSTEKSWRTIQGNIYTPLTPLLHPTL